MGKKNDVWVECSYCGTEIPKKKAIYVEGRPYCEDCSTEAETYVDLEHDDQGFEDDDNDDDD